MVELLSRLVPSLNDLVIDTSSEILIGYADFEGIMRTVSRGLMGTEQVVTDAMLARLRAVSSENAARLRLDGDLVMVHDTAPLLRVESRSPSARWVWRGHHDLSSPHPQHWTTLHPFA